jgi:tetratricopeptide (TPR) repeat protein
VPNPGAYEACLRGLYYTGLLTKEGFKLAEEQFTRAIAIDSLYPLGYAGLAGIMLSRRQMGFVQGDQIILKLDSLYEITLRLDSTNADVLTGLAGHYTWSKYDWEKGEKFFKKSIEINPNSAPPRAYYAHFLAILGRIDEAWEQMDMAIALDPHDPWVLGFSAVMYGGSGKMLSASKQANKLIQLAPDNPLALDVLLQKHVTLNNEEKAIKQLIKILQLYEVPNIEKVAMSGFNKGGFKSGVKEIVTYMETNASDYFVRANLMVTMYGWLGDKKKQEEWLLIL